jgi:hypothetical protein
MTGILIFMLGLSAYVGVCWVLFVWLWPAKRQQDPEPLKWPNSVFDRKEK